MPNSDRILLSLPEVGKVEQYHALGGKIFELDFDVAQTIISRNEDDMIIAGQQAGSIELMEIYKEGATDTPGFILQDNTELSTPEFIATYDPPITTQDGEDDFTYTQHPAISVSVDEEDLNTPVEVSIQAGYTVDTDARFGWTEGTGTPGTFTQDVVLDGESVGQFIYDDTTKQVSFVLTKPVSHDSDAAVEIASQLWLRNPDGLLVRPTVEVEVTADLLDAPQFWLGSRGSQAGYANILASSANGYWNPSADPDADYSLSFQLLGYEMQTVDLVPLQSKTVQIDGKAFFTITLNPIGTFTIRFHTDYNPSSSSKSEAPLTGPLYFKFTATDASGHNSSSYESTVELCMTETRFGNSTGQLLAHVEADPVLESSLRDGGAGDETEVRIPGLSGSPWQIMFTEAQSDANGGNLAFQAEWVRDDAAGKWVLETANGWLEYRDADSTYPGSVDTKLFYVLKAGMDHSTDSGLVGEHLDNIPIVLYSSGLGFGKPFQISVTVPVTDDDPEVRFAQSVAEINAAHTEGLDVSFAMSGDGPAVSNAYEVIFTNLQTGEIQSVSLSAVGSTGTLTFQNSDGSSYDVAVTLENGKLYLKASQDLNETVPYNVSLVLTDADGDSAMSSIAVNVKGFGLGDGFTLAVDEADIVAQNAVDTVTIPAEWALDTSTWTDDGSGTWSKDFTVAGEVVGTLTYDGSTISVTLDKPVDHAAAGRDVLNIDHGQITLVSVANSADTVDVPLMVKITDDIPNVNLEAVTGEHISGNPIDGEYSFGYGADGPHATSPITVSIELKDSGLTASANVTVGGPAVTLTDAGGTVIGTFELVDGKNYIFIPADGTIDKAVITLTVMDKDGDKVEAATPGEITILSYPDPVTTDTVNESGLPGGTDSAADVVVSFPVPEGWEPDPSQWTDLSGGGMEYVPTDGTPGRFTYIPGDPADPADNGTIEFELTGPINHPDPDTADVSDITTKVPLQHTGSGATGDLELTIPVQDDVPDPALEPTTPGSDPVSGAEFEIDFTPNYGADGKGSEPDELSFEIVPKGADPADPPVTGSVDMPTSSTPVDLEDDDGVIYGTVHIDGSTGKLIFTPAPNMEYEIGMTVTVTDADGDKGADSLGAPLQVAPPPPPVDPIELAGDVDESWLTGGNQAVGGSVSQVVNIVDPAYELDIAKITSDWTQDSTATPPTYTLDLGTDGKLIYTEGAAGASGTLVYELTAPQTHPGAGPDSTVLTLDGKVPLMHSATKNTYDVNLPVTVVDDTPIVSVTDAITISQGATDSSGTWSVAHGADGNDLGANDHFSVLITAGGSEVLRVDDYTPGDAVGIPGYGTVTFEPGGSVTFAGSPNSEYDIAITISATDSDGDISSHTLNVVSVDTSMLSLPTAELYEENLGHGSNPDSSALIFWINPTDTSHPNYNAENVKHAVDLTQGGWEPLAGNSAVYYLGDVDADGTPLGAGLLLCDADGTNLRYELSDRFAHDNPPAGTSSDKNSAEVLFDQVVFKDSLNNEYKPPIRVTIVDDIPEASFNVPSGAVDTGTTYIPDGTDDYKLQFGADGSPDAQSGIRLDVTFTDAGGLPVGSYSIDAGIGSIPITIDGRTYGTLVLSEGNKFEFIASRALTSDPVGLLGTFNFTLTVTDRDGDTTDPASFELELHKPDFDEPIPPTDLDVREANLADGTSPDPSALTKTWDLGGNTVDTSSWAHTGGTVYTKTTGTGVLTYDTSDPNKIVYSLTDNDRHAAQGEDDLEHVFSGLVLLDADGNAYSYEIKVNVVDDVPLLGDGTDETIEESSVGAGGNPFTSEGSFKVLLGADGVDGNDADHFTLTLQVDSDSSNYPGTTNAALQIPRDGTQGTPIEIYTKLGVLLLEYDSATNQISYSYQAHRGSKDDYEKISYSVVDTDGDLVQQDFTITLAEDIKEGHLHLSESALPFGSNNPLNTVDIQDETELLGIPFAGGTAAIEWDIDAIQDSYSGFLLEADGNQDGEYQQVVWSTDGITLTGTADGVVVFRATAIFTNDSPPQFTGRITAELSAAFKHNKSADDLDLSFDLKFTQISAGGDRVESIVKVTIDDDSPYSGKNTQPIYVEEIPERYEEVFITLDCSETMEWGAGLGDGRTRKDVTVDALVELMEAYQANGINAKFTLIGFAHIATGNPEFAGITAGEFLDLYQALVDAGGVQHARDMVWSLIRQDYTSSVEFGTPGNMTTGIGTWTNYEAGTEQLINELNKAMADSERNSAEKTVFFMTDGQSSFGDPENWYEYLSQHSGEFDVYTIGMSSEIRAEDENRLVEMADGKSENFVLVKDFSKLSEILQGFIKPVTGSLLDNLGSADVNTLSEIWIAAAGLTNIADVQNQGTNYKINPATGQTDEITIGTGADAIKLVIYADGTYRVVAGNVPEDIPRSIVITIKDADGDEITTEVIELVIKDAKPTAYDNVAEYDLYNGDTSNLSVGGEGFSQADNTSGNWNLTNAGFIDANGSGLSITDTGLPSSLIGSHYLHLKAAANLDSSYFEHMGHKMFLWDFVETELGIDLNEISGPTEFNPGTWGYYSMASHTVTAVSGTISFNWHALGSEGDYSFYFLMDSRGNIVDSGVLAKLEASGEANGAQVIDIPMNDGSEEYTIVFGTLETSSDVSRQGRPMNPSELFINAVVVEEDAYDYKGNILTDPSPTGDVDLMYDMATLYSIKVGNTEYAFDGKHQLEITTSYGTLIVNKNGDYTYKVASGDPKAVIDQFTYVIEDRDLGEQNRSEAELIIQWHKPVAVETVAELNSGGGAFKGNVLTDQSLYGETDQCYTTSYLTSFTLDGQTVTFSGKDDGPQSITTSQGTLSIAADGTYTFTLESGVNASQVNLKGTYTINDGDADQGSLLIKVVEPHAQDNAAESGDIYLHTEVLDTFAGGTGSWHSVGVSGMNLTTGPFPAPAVDLSDLYLASFLKPPVHSALAGVTDDNYLIISGVGALSGNQLLELFDVTENTSLADRLNTMGLTADNVVGMATNTLQGSFASREFATTGGKLVFDWSFAGKQNAADADAAIYILQDANGNLVGSGTLGQLLNAGSNNVKKSGVAEIDIPVSAIDQTYTLYVGTLQAGTGSNATIGQSASQLLIGSVVMQEELCHFAGNLLADASPDGMRDFGVADGTISSITYDGTVYEMTGTQIEIATSSGGKLIVKADGTYTYSDTPGSSGNLVAENFEYTVQTAYGEDSAMLFIRGDAYKVESDQMADIDLSSSGYANAPYLLVTGNNAEKITGGTNDNVIFAGGGDDTIFGGSGNDHINGGLGDDFISAGRGDNVLTGGAGADTFSWNKNSMSGTDVIKDFSTIQEDKLAFSDLLGSGESMDSFFKDHITSVSLLENENRIEFTIQNGRNASKAVELNFTSDDSNFSQLVSDYNNASDSAQQELIVSFLIQHSITS